LGYVGISKILCQDNKNKNYEGHSVKSLKSYEQIEEATRNILNRKILEAFAWKYRNKWTTVEFDLDDIDLK
jgi:hypothetical protein